MLSEDGKVRRPRRGGGAIGCAIVRGDRIQSQTSWSAFISSFLGLKPPNNLGKECGVGSVRSCKRGTDRKRNSPESFTSQLGGEGQRLLIARLGRKRMFVYNQQG